MIQISQRTFVLVLAVNIVSLLWQHSYGQSGQDKGRVRVAQDLERRGSYESALRIYRTLFEEVPNNQLYYEGVKRNMLRLKRYDQLIAIIESQIRVSDDVKFPADLGDVYYRRGDADRGSNIWTTLLANHPHNKAVYPYVASAMLSNRLYDEAIEVYKRARVQFNDPLLFVYELANIYIIRLNYKQATIEYLHYLEEHPNQFGYIEGRIASYTKDSDQAQDIASLLKEALLRANQKALIRRLLADLYLRVEEYAQSLQEFKILENDQNAAAPKSKEAGKELYFFGEKALVAGEYEYATEAFDLILSKHPDSPFRIRALYGSALAKQKQGAFNEAIQSYQELIAAASKSPWAQEAMFQTGEIYFMDFFDVAKALETYTSLIQRWPSGRKTVDTYFRIGDCHAAMGELKQAQNWYEQSLAIDSKGIVENRALYKSAYVDFVHGDFDTAAVKLSRITTTLGDTKDQSYVNDALELSILIEENRDSSADASDEALRLYVAAQRFRLQRRYAEAVRQLQEILTSFPAAPIVDESLLDLGDLENSRGNYAAAIGYLESLLNDHEESIYNALAQKRIGEIYELGLGDLKKASDAYELVLVNYPQSLYLEEVRQKLRELQTRQVSN